MGDKKIKCSKNKKLRKDEIWEKIGDLSSGVLATGIDLVLFFIFQGMNLGEYGYGSIAARRATEASIDDVLACGIDKETIKKAIWKATHRKLIKRPKKNERLFEITREGSERLKSLLPEYQSKRAWDSHFYLMTYDIPEKRHRDRDLLREFLRKIGCGMLQASVWLTPYNRFAKTPQFIAGDEGKARFQASLEANNKAVESLPEKTLGFQPREAYNPQQILKKFIVAGQNTQLSQSWDECPRVYTSEGWEL